MLDGLPLNLLEQRHDRDGHVGELEYREQEKIEYLFVPDAVYVVPLGYHRHGAEDKEQSVEVHKGLDKRLYQRSGLGRVGRESHRYGRRVYDNAQQRHQHGGHDRHQKVEA